MKILLVLALCLESLVSQASANEERDFVQAFHKRMTDKIAQSREEFDSLIPSFPHDSDYNWYFSEFDKRVSHIAPNTFCYLMAILAGGSDDTTFFQRKPVAEYYINWAFKRYMDPSEILYSILTNDEQFGIQFEIEKFKIEYRNSEPLFNR